MVRCVMGQDFAGSSNKNSLCLNASTQVLCIVSAQPLPDNLNRDQFLFLYHILPNPAKRPLFGSIAMSKRAKSSRILVLVLLIFFIFRVSGEPLPGRALLKSDIHAFALFKSQDCLGECEVDEDCDEDLGCYCDEDDLICTE